MTRDTLFVVTLLIVSALSAYIAHGMFQVGTMKELEKSKMYFAAAVLAFLSFIFIFSAILYVFGPESNTSSAEAPGKVIFDACVKIIPPMVTLILGFYFGASQSHSTNNTDKNAVEHSKTTSESSSIAK